MLTDGKFAVENELLWKKNVVVSFVDKTWRGKGRGMMIQTYLFDLIVTNNFQCLFFFPNIIYMKNILSIMLSIILSISL